MGLKKVLKEVLRKFHVCFRKISRKVSRMFQDVSLKFCCCMALIAATRAEEGLVNIDVRVIASNSRPFTVAVEGHIGSRQWDNLLRSVPCLKRVAFRNICNFM